MRLLVQIVYVRKELEFPVAVWMIFGKELRKMGGM